MQEEFKSKKDKWREWWGKSAGNILQVHHIEYIDSLSNINKKDFQDVIRLINPTQDNFVETLRKYELAGSTFNSIRNRINNMLNVLRELKGRDYRVVYASDESSHGGEFIRIVLKKEPQPLLSKSVKRNIRFNSIIKKKRNDFQSI